MYAPMAVFYGALVGLVAISVRWLARRHGFFVVMVLVKNNKSATPDSNVIHYMLYYIVMW